MIFENKYIEIDPIGIAHSCFTDKFGIPRQSNLVPAARASLEIFPPYNKKEAFFKLEEFSHLWLTFYFHDAVRRGWKPTVRPPRLGGNKRVGVFASRSPQRPNYLGLSVVKLENIAQKNKNIFLEVSGVDILDKTPIIDIKPYIPYSDHVQAQEGYAPHPSFFEVSFSKDASLFCDKYKTQQGPDLAELIKQVLSLDPRPAYHTSEQREYGMDLWDLNITFTSNNDRFFVEKIYHKK